MQTKDKYFLFYCILFYSNSNELLVSVLREVCRCLRQSLTSDNKISLNGLHQGQGVYLHRAAFPLFNISAVWVSLQLTLELMCVEELQCLRAPGDTH